jgi:hypothetical protein
MALQATESRDAAAALFEQPVSLRAVVQNYDWGRKLEEGSEVRTLIWRYASWAFDLLAHDCSAI